MHVLTMRQRQVLSLLAHGWSNKQISNEVGISEAGVKKHLEALRRRYDAPNRTALVTAAIEAKDLSPRPDIGERATSR